MLTGVKISKSCQGSLRPLMLYFWGPSLSFKATDFLFITYGIYNSVTIPSKCNFAGHCSKGPPYLNPCMLNSSVSYHFDVPLRYQQRKNLLSFPPLLGKPILGSLLYLSPIPPLGYILTSPYCAQICTDQWWHKCVCILYNN